MAEEEEWISKGNELLERVKECLEQYGQAWIGARAKKRENELRSGVDSGRDRKLECAITC